MRLIYPKVILLLLISNILSAQHSKPLKADEYLNVLNNSRDSLYKQILRDFEQYLNENPEDVTVQINHCEFIGEAYYDSYDEYNPLEEEYNACVSSLIANFSDNHRVLLYQLDNCWGDSAIRVANKILDMNRSDPGSWPDHELALAYQKLANTYSYSGTTDQVIESAELAQLLNDSLDLTYLLAQQYEKKNLYSKSIELLMSRIDSTEESYLAYNKAILLLELGQEKEALHVLQTVQNDTTLYIDNGEIARALIVNEKYDDARAYLLKDLASSYDQSAVLHQLFEFDYQHSSKDSLLATYNKLMDEDFNNDTFGVYRFMLLFKAPFSGWNWNDLLKLFFFCLLLMVPFLIPYLYVLPIDFVSRRFGINHAQSALQSSNWTLTDFWLVSSFFFTIELLVWMMFNYGDLLSNFNDMYVEEGIKISINQANEAIVFFLMMFIMVIGYLKKTDYQFLLSKHWKVGKSIGLGVLCAFLLRTIYFTLSRKGILPGIEMTMLSSVMDYLKSINQYYHPALAFLFAVILVPFYEEYIFRGIFLNSMNRRIKFIAANVIQSVLFALVHENWSLFLFYFFTGLITGYLVKKSNSLLPALSMHATNNLLAFIAIMRM